jgi:Bacteriophage Mu, Gp27
MRRRRKMMKAERKTRGKPSKVNQLPDAIKNKLDQLLRDGRLTQTAILEKINKMIDEAELDEDEQLSKSGLNRYSNKMQAIGSRIAQARAVSEQWVAKLGDKPSGDVSKILIEMVRTLAFDSVLDASNADQPVHPKFIKDLAIGIEKLEKAATESTKREKEIRKAFAEEAAALVEDAAVQAGLTTDGANAIKREILGIA